MNDNIPIGRTMATVVFADNKVVISELYLQHWDEL